MSPNFFTMFLDFLSKSIMTLEKGKESEKDVRQAAFPSVGSFSVSLKLIYFINLLLEIENSINGEYDVFEFLNVFFVHVMMRVLLLKTIILSFFYQFYARV